MVCYETDKPRYGNAQDAQMLYALDDALVQAHADDGVAAIVLGAAGKHFSSGHEIGTPRRDSAEPAPRRASLRPDHVGRPGAEAAYVREYELYLRLCPHWRAGPEPIVAAVQGPCIAGVTTQDIAGKSHV